MKKLKWVLACRHRPRMCDGVEVTKENGCFTIYRYIDDWDEEGDSIYEVEEYLTDIQEQEIKTAIGTNQDTSVIQWIKAHLIKKESNSIDAIADYFETHQISYGHERNGYKIK